MPGFESIYDRASKERKKVSDWESLLSSRCAIRVVGVMHCVQQLAMFLLATAIEMNDLVNRTRARGTRSG